MIYALICMGGLGLLFGIGLAIASKVFSVQKDPRCEAIAEILPNANCGGCGFAGCSAYAETVAKGEAKFNLCTAGGQEVADKIAAIMGGKSESFSRNVAYVRCQGKSHPEAQYEGPMTCAQAAIVAQGPYACKFSCLMLGDCAHACPFGVIKHIPGCVPYIDPDICHACGACAKVCPRNVIAIAPCDKPYHVACQSYEKPVIKRKNCETACIGCQKCVKNCPEGAIAMDGTVARIDKQKCTACGKCIEGCPTHAIRSFLTQREAAKEAHEI